MALHSCFTILVLLFTKVVLFSVNKFFLLVSSRRDFLREGGMQMVVQVMNDCRHGNDEEIQRLACQAIREYCCESGNLYGMGCHVIVQWLCV